MFADRVCCGYWSVNRSIAVRQHPSIHADSPGTQPQPPAESFAENIMRCRVMLACAVALLPLVQYSRGYMEIGDLTHLSVIYGVDSVHSSGLRLLYDYCPYHTAFINPFQLRSVRGLCELCTV